jgi:KRAB domain-containing zinc finger protein
MKLHLLRHISPPKFKCKDCEKNFHTRSDVKRHSLIHKDVNKIQTLFSCPICQKIFKRKDQCRQHEAMHGIRERVECEICHKFLHKRNLKTHLKGHRNLREHFCGFCNKGFNRASILNRHLKIHERKKSGKFPEN